MPPIFVRRFDELCDADVEWAGAKGAALGELAHAGFPLLDGFVIGADAYRRFLAETGASGQIAARLDQVDPADPDGRQQAAADINVLIAAAPLPVAVRDAIAGAYTALSPPAANQATVVVHPSPGPGDARSRLPTRANGAVVGVRGLYPLLIALRRCWASAYGESGLAVRGDLAPPSTGLDMAVVVQRQLPGAHSGLMVTGEPVEDPGLRDDQVATLAGLGAAVEDRLGARHVVEWALDPAGRVWILQARPLRRSGRRTASA